MSGNDDEAHQLRQFLSYLRASQNDQFNGLDLAKISPDCRKTLLHSAAIWNNGAVVRSLIAMGIDVDTLNFNSETALMMAVEMRSAEVVEVLLNANADVDIASADGTTALRMVFHPTYRCTEILQLFLRRLRRDYSSVDALLEMLIGVGCSMYHACFLRDLRAMELLLERGVDVNSRGYSCKSALHAAVELNDLALATWTLDRGVRVDGEDDEGKSPLLDAASHGKVNMVRLLLERGADPNFKRAHNGHTPLYGVFAYSAIDGDQEKFDECAEILLQHGAIPNNARDDHHTIFDCDLANRSSNKRIYYVICQLAILENLGEVDVKSVMCHNIGDHQSIVNHLDRLFGYYASIKKLLAIRVYNELSLFHLLTASAAKMSILVRNKVLVTIVSKVLYPVLSEACPYYHRMLARRIAKAEERVRLEDAAIDKLFSGDYNLWYCFARQMVRYLGDGDLELLASV